MSGTGYDPQGGVGAGGVLPEGLFTGDTLVWDDTDGAWERTAVTPIYLTPRGEGLDDGPNLQTMLDTWADSRKVSLVKGATYQIDTPVEVPSNTFLDLNGAAINTDIGLIGSPLNSVFFNNIAIAFNTTVSASTTPGTRTVTIAALGGFVVGSLIRLSKGGLQSQTYTIVSIAGVGPFTITVERPILYQFDAADVASLLTSMPEDIIIEGGGALIAGTADRFIEFAGSRRCIIRNIRGEYSGAANANIMFSYDVGGYDNVFENLECDGGAAMQLGISLESQEDSHILNCKAHNVTNWGFPLYTCAHCTIQYSEAFRCGNGFGFVADGASPGCIDCDILESHGTGNTTDGIVIQNLSHRCRIIGGSYSYNGGHGLNIAASSLDSSVSDVLFQGNLTRQVILFAGTNRTKITGCQIHSAANTVGIYNLGQLYCSNTSIRDGNYGVYGDGETHLTSVAIQNVSLTALEVRPGRFATVHNCDFHCAAVGLTAMTLVAVSKCYVDGLTLSGLGAGGTGITVQAGSTLRFHDYDPGAAAVALNVIAGGFASIGALVSNGTGAAQAVAWPDIKVTDNVDFTRTLNGGAPGLDPTIVVTAGVGFTAAFAAGDTSTYQWRID